MTTMIWCAAVFCGLATLLHIVSTIVATVRCRASAAPVPAPRDAPPVTIVRPVCGIDHGVDETLRSSLTLDYPACEVIFCAASARDPVVPLVERLIAEHPRVRARLLIGDDWISHNPKLNNVVKGWQAAAHDWIIMADSNVLMPPDYVTRLLATFGPGVGLVCAPPIGARPESFWAELECAFLNTYQARWQYLSDSIGFGFAQGKTMLWRREILERAGGITALAQELAEDAAASKVVRAAGLRVTLVDAPFGQPLGRRGAREVWQRQVRWARLRRASFELFYMPEILTGALWPLIAAGVAAAGFGWSMTLTLLGVAATWYGGEYALSRAAGWRLSWRTPFAWMLRDLLLPMLWISGWAGKEFVWRGNHMRIADDSRAT